MNFETRNGFRDGWIDAVHDMRKQRRIHNNRYITLRTARSPRSAFSADYLCGYLAAYNTIERGYIAGWHFGQPDTERFELVF